MATIGITDSGIGGLTILERLIRYYPNHRYIYLADNLNAPYGLKTKDKIAELTINCCDRLIDMSADIIVIACNTATSAAIESIRQSYNIDIIGTEPAVIPALKDNKQNILVLATPFTIYSRRYIELIYGNEHIISCPCVELAGLIEGACPDFYILYDYMYHLLSKYQNIDAIVLGCTHYVLIRDLIQEIMPHAVIYDSTEGIVNRVKQITKELEDDKEHPSVKLLSTGFCNMCGYRQLLEKLLI